MYDGQYSLTFGNNEKNTWTTWRLIPSTPPVVQPPEPNLNYVEIPGRAAGPIDLSTYPLGRLTYKRITGSWTFLRETTHQTMRVEMYEEIRRWLHGRNTTVKLQEDPNHFFQGRFTVSAPQNSQGPTQITINYDLEPRRYNSNGTVDTNWVVT